MDSDEESEGGASVGATLQAAYEELEELGTAVLYEGDPISIAQGTGAWVPVVTALRSAAADTETLVVLPSTDSPVEAVPGMWSTGDEQGMICVIGQDEFDTVLEPGAKGC